MTKLICPDCQHENETERIYCHNCGARLDRSGLVKESSEEGHAEEKTRQHLKKMFSPHRGLGKEVAFKFAKMLLGALCLAVVIVMLLPPDLPAAPKSYDFAPLINMDMVSAISSQRPPVLTYDENQVNSYLAAALRRKDGPAQQGVAPLRRLFVQFEEGQCRVNLERRILSFSIFAGNTYRVKIVDGRIVATSEGGYIGRLPIPAPIMKYGDLLFSRAWDCLARERNSISHLAQIEFHPRSVSLVVTR